jgi:hypothetical protein
MQIDRPTTKPTQEALAAIDALNLECVRTRMTDGQLGKGWTDEHANRVEALYRRFLQLVVKYPEDAESLVISSDVDEFRHAHIIHTRKYAEDCEAIFGFFLHHTPRRRTGTESGASEHAASTEKAHRSHERQSGGVVQGRRRYRSIIAAHLSQRTPPANKLLRSPKPPTVGWREKTDRNA